MSAGVASFAAQSTTYGRLPGDAYYGLNNADASGNVTLPSNLTVDGMLTVKGTSTFDSLVSLYGTPSSLGTAGDVYMGGNLAMTSPLPKGVISASSITSGGVFSSGVIQSGSPAFNYVQIGTSGVACFTPPPGPATIAALPLNADFNGASAPVYTGSHADLIVGTGNPLSLVGSRNVYCNIVDAVGGFSVGKTLVPVVTGGNLTTSAGVLAMLQASAPQAIGQFGIDQIPGISANPLFFFNITYFAAVVPGTPLPTGWGSVAYQLSGTAPNRIITLELPTSSAGGIEAIINYMCIL